MEMEKPMWEAPASQEQPKDLGLSAVEQDFMDRGDVPAELLAKFKARKKQEEGLDLSPAESEFMRGDMTPAERAMYETWKKQQGAEEGEVESGTDMAA